MIKEKLNNLRKDLRSAKEMDSVFNTIIKRLEQDNEDWGPSEGLNNCSISNDAVGALEKLGFTLLKHQNFVLTLDIDKNTMMYCATEHLRMQGVFWGLCAMDLLGMKEMMPLDDIVAWVKECYHPEDGGFGGNVYHDSHMLYTQHAIYILALCDALDWVDHNRVAFFIKDLQQGDGSFAGDKWGEVDTRFTYCALAALAVLDRLDAVDLPKANRFIVSCRNFDGGFGAVPDAESHAGYIFTCVGALSIGGGLDLISKQDWDVLAWWLCERQCDSGGLNGRPEKQADVCYSWWVLSSLSVLQRVDWISKSRLMDYILNCQDPDTGGISDRPDCVGDVYHTFFGLCGLSLLGFFRKHEKNTGFVVNSIDPVFALPRYVTKKLGLRSDKV